MAQTYTLAATGVTLLANKSIIGFYNGTGSGRIVRLYKVWLLNNQVTAVTGTTGFMELRTITTGSGGTALSPVKHDSNNENFPAQVISATNLSYTNRDLIIRTYWCSDEPTPITSTTDEVLTIPSFGTIYEAAYSGTNVEPIVCREGYGVTLNNITSIVGICDAFFEVTLETT